MPPEEFVLNAGNVRGRGAHVSVVDPLTGEETAVEVTRADADSLQARARGMSVLRPRRRDSPPCGPGGMRISTE